MLTLLSTGLLNTINISASPVKLQAFVPPIAIPTMPWDGKHDKPVAPACLILGRRLTHAPSRFSLSSGRVPAILATVPPRVT